MKDKMYKANLPNPSDIKCTKNTEAITKRESPLRQLFLQVSRPLVEMYVEVFVHAF